MYHSRLYLTNGIISYELDALNGEPLAFVREDRADNARKNHFTEITGILDGQMDIGGKLCHLNIPRYAQIRPDPSMKPTITTWQGEGEANAEIFYPHLVADGEKAEVSAWVKLRLLPGDCRSYWELKLENRTDSEIVNVSFPEISGLWLGDSWKDDTLILPRVSGSKIENPTKIIAEPPTVITWKWQEYLHKYRLNRNGTADDRGLYFFRCLYTGGSSMLWLDLYNRKENSGIYLTARDPEMKFKDIHVYSKGEYCPGVGIGILHNTCLTKGAWESPECILAFHEGDWHWAADQYHRMRDSYSRPVLTEPSRPDWFEKSPGIAAHYDFRYQDGGVIHRFADIPALYRKAETWGLDHLLISGWNEDGFDWGFPHYAPDVELGGPEGLKKAVEEVHKMGGRISLYLNSRLCNMAFPEQKRRVEESAVMKRGGKLHIEAYGAGDSRFATLCMSESKWRRDFANDVRYILQEIGADGVYLDQFAMAAGMTCYHPGHREHAGNPAAWNQGYEKLLDIIRAENPGKAIFYEGCCDIFGRGVSGQLVSTLRQTIEDVTPEIYRYTFPEEVLVDMENPRRHSGMRAEHVARRSTFYLYRGFVCGMYFWVYDLEEDNTFSRDPEQEQRLKKTTQLRTLWLEKYGYGIFRDQEKLVEVGEQTLYKCYDVPGGMLIACADEKGLSGTVTAKWESSRRVRVTIHTEKDHTPVEQILEAANGTVTVSLPDTELALIILEKA